MFKTHKQGVDAYAKLRTQRLAAEAVARTLKAQEDVVEEWLLTNLPINRETAGQHGIASIEPRIKYVMTSLDLLFNFASSKNAPEFLISRINEKTCREWQTANKQKPIPGVVVLERNTLIFRSY